MIGRPPKTLLERLNKYISPEPMSGCWLWTGSLEVGGYAQTYVRNGVGDYERGRKAHRVLWEYLNGPVPEDKELDHKCRVRSCVNPQHLEVVTHRENTLRGEAVSAINYRKTHCKNGHPLFGENLYIMPAKRQVISRQCRICKRERLRKSRASR